MGGGNQIQYGWMQIHSVNFTARGHRWLCLETGAGITLGGGPAPGALACWIAGSLAAVRASMSQTVCSIRVPNGRLAAGPVLYHIGTVMPGSRSSESNECLQSTSAMSAGLTRMGCCRMERASRFGQMRCWCADGRSRRTGSG